MEKGHYNRERNRNTNESAMVVHTPKKKKKKEKKEKKGKKKNGFPFKGPQCLDMSKHLEVGKKKVIELG
jgi:hypothetical protein